MEKNYRTLVDLTNHLAIAMADRASQTTALIDNPSDAISVVISACMDVVDVSLLAASANGCPPEIIAGYRSQIAGRIMSGTKESEVVVVVDKHGVSEHSIDG